IGMASPTRPPMSYVRAIRGSVRGPWVTRRLATLPGVGLGLGTRVGRGVGCAVGRVVGLGVGDVAAGVADAGAIDGETVVVGLGHAVVAIGLALVGGVVGGSPDRGAAVHPA
ncbi:MAG TPA: hypothetical protein VF484_05105, partial [Candidatus Limnocylindrales bacterium]